MKIINTYESILKYFPSGKFDISTWKSYISEVSLNLLEKCEQDSAEYDLDKDVIPVINNALNQKDKMQIVNSSFTTISDVLPDNMHNLFDSDIELDIILYLGLCNGAGWATTLNNKNTILLGIEKIIELNWYDIDSMQGLIFHEIGHIWHKTYGNFYYNAASIKEKSIRQLYQEGIAMVCEQILCNDNNYFHQNKNGWLDWCQKNEISIKKEYLNRLNNKVSTQDFFGDWCDYQGHSDVGYYLGCIFIKYLQQKYSLIEIANLSCNTILNEFEIFAG